MTPEMTLIVLGYYVWANLVALVTFKLFTIDDWLENWCNQNRDAEFYQLGGPP